MLVQNRNQSDTRQRSHRYGAALIEFAICMPVFFLLAMGTIETCRMMYLRQSLKLAAYECARLGIMPGVTTDILQFQCDLILRGRHIRNYEFSCQPNDLSVLRFGDPLTIKVDTAAEDNALVGAWWYQEKMLSESVVIMAEQ